MRKVNIEWRYFAKHGKTCKRCCTTGDNLKAAYEDLKKELVLHHVEPVLKKTLLLKSKIPESNTILIDGDPIELIVPNSRRGESECCSCGNLCGKPTDCRTIELNNTVFEDIPTSLIKEAVYKKLNINVGKEMKK